MRNIYTFSVLVVLVLSSFIIKDQGGISSSSNGTRVTIGSHTWTLTTIYRDDGYTQVLTGTAFINFQTENDKAGGNGSCNSFGAIVTINGSTISFKNISSTKMYCEDVQSIENDFFRQLRKVTRYEVKGNKLLLFEGDKILLEFVG